MSASPDHGGQVPGARVAVRHRRVAGEQQHADRLAEDGAAAHDDGPLAGRVDVVRVEQPHDAARRARHEARQAETHRREGGEGDAVDVLLGRDRLERGPLVDVFTHRVLQQDAVHAGIVGQ